MALVLKSNGIIFKMHQKISIKAYFFKPWFSKTFCVYSEREVLITFRIFIHEFLVRKVNFGINGIRVNEILKLVTLQNDLSRVPKCNHLMYSMEKEFASCLLCWLLTWQHLWMFCENVRLEYILHFLINDKKPSNWEMIVFQK